MPPEAAGLYLLSSSSGSCTGDEGLYETPDTSSSLTSFSSAGEYAGDCKLLGPPEEPGEYAGEAGLYAGEAGL